MNLNMKILLIIYIKHNRNGKFTKIGPQLEAKAGERIIEENGCLLLPPFVESHIHLDTLLTAGEPRWNESGTLFEGIRIWSERR